MFFVGTHVNRTRACLYRYPDGYTLYVGRNVYRQVPYTIVDRIITLFRTNNLTQP